MTAWVSCSHISMTLPPIWWSKFALQLSLATKFGQKQHSCHVQSLCKSTFKYYLWMCTSIYSYSIKNVLANQCTTLCSQCWSVCEWRTSLSNAHYANSWTFLTHCHLWYSCHFATYVSTFSAYFQGFNHLAM